jgi:hypothetical protein
MNYLAALVARTAQFLRRQLRWFAAVAFWANALFIISVPRFPSKRLATLAGISVPEVLLTCALLSLAALSTYGFKNFAVDIIYVYLFPFIFLFKLGRVFWRFASKIPGVFAAAVGQEVPTIDWNKLFVEIRPDGTPAEQNKPPPTIAVTPLPSTAVPIVNAPTDKRGLARFIDNATLPLRSVTFLWCLLLLVATKPVVLIVSLLIVLIHLFRFLASLIGSIREATAYLDGAERRILGYVIGAIGQIMQESGDAEPSQDTVKTVSRLALWRGACFFASNYNGFSFWLLLVGVGLYLLMYARVSFLFAFVYFGLCKLQGQHLGFLDSMMGSLTMPFSFTDFPRTWPVRLMEGIHTLVLLTIGIGAVRAYIRRKISSLSGAARKVWERLDDDAVRQKMTEIARRSPQLAPRARQAAQ